MLTVIPHSIRNLATYILGKDPTINANKNDKSPSPMGTAIVAISIGELAPIIRDSTTQAMISALQSIGTQALSVWTAPSHSVAKPMGSEMIVWVSSQNNAKGNIFEELPDLLKGILVILCLCYCAGCAYAMNYYLPHYGDPLHGGAILLLDDEPFDQDDNAPFDQVAPAA